MTTTVYHGPHSKPTNICRLRSAASYWLGVHVYPDVIERSAPRGIGENGEDSLDACVDDIQWGIFSLVSSCSDTAKTVIGEGLSDLIVRVPIGFAID